MGIGVNNHIWIKMIMRLSKIIRSNRKEILKIAKSYGAKSLKVFGSCARGEDNTDSDIDLLIELEGGRSLLDIVAIKHEIESLTQRKVDVVTEKGIHWYIKDRILDEAVTL